MDVAIDISNTLYFWIAANVFNHVFSKSVDQSKIAKRCAIKYFFLMRFLFEIGFLQYKLHANVFFGNCLHVECITTAKALAITQK